MKVLIKQIMPPLLVTVFKKLLPSPPQYETYEEAVDACQNGAYQNNDLVKVVVEKNLIYRQEIQKDAVFNLDALHTLIAVGLSKKGDSLNVIDFGGAGGYHYTVASKALGKSTTLNWNVVETTAMAKAAGRIAVDGLKFFDSITEAVNDLGDVDLVLTSGALQYTPNPIAFLRKLIDVNAEYIYITRTPLSEKNHSIITTQQSELSSNGPGPLTHKYKNITIKYPITYVSRQSIENIISEKYVIRFKTREGEGVFKMPNARMSMDGYFCVRKG